MSDDDYLYILASSPLGRFKESANGHPYNEWVVTDAFTAEGWWGEGYVIHTTKPFLLFKWGYTTKEESEAMSGGIKINESHYLSILLLNAEKQPLDGKLRRAALESVHAFVVYSALVWKKSNEA